MKSTGVLCLAVCTQDPYSDLSFFLSFSLVFLPILLAMKRRMHKAALTYYLIVFFLVVLSYQVLMFY